MSQAASVIYWKHVLVPQRRDTIAVSPGHTIRDVDPAWDRPYIALLDGKPVLRRDWNLVLAHGQVLAFVDVEAIPQGGGGSSNPMQIIASLAMVAVAIYAPYALAAMNVSGLVSSGTLTGWGAALTSGVMILGSAAINILLPSTSQQSNSSSLTASSTYSLSAQGNTARIEAAIPEQFGRMSFYPDYASQPYQEYHGNDQYLYQLFCIGRGEYDIEAFFIEDTPLENFEDITYEIVSPNTSPTLFPAQVTTASEVSGNEMDYNDYVGPFVANAEGTSAIYIGVDFIFPRGLYYYNDDGVLENQSVTARVEAREIDDNGDPVGDGSYTVLGDISVIKATATPQRLSYRYSVTAGRYEVRVKRTNEENTGTSYANEITWGSLRAYLQSTLTYGDTTVVAMRMRATNQLTSTSSTKIRVLATRKLPIWDGEAWSANTSTRGIAWAAAYAAKQAGLTDSQIDLDSLLSLDSVWAARGDTADGRFDNFVSWWDAMGTILSAGRAKPYMQAGLLRFFRDQYAETPVCLFSMRNIVKGSFSVEYLMPTDDTADCVKVTYFDSATWKQRKVLAALPESTSETPATVDLSGIVTSRDQAYREGMYQAACNRYRRKVITFTTEMEGFIPSFGDLIAIQHDVPAWGQGGEAVAWDAETSTLTCSEPLTWEEGSTHYIALRGRNGQVYGPYECTAGASDSEAVFLEAPAIEVYTGSDEERTYYSFGWSSTYYQDARVVYVRPRSETQVEIQAVNEDDNVHSAETGVTTPVAPTSQLANYTAAPEVAGLIARSDPSDPDIIMLSWQASPWAERYIVEQGIIGGDAWTTAGETSSTNITFRVLFGNATQVRVAAIGIAKGPWVTLLYGNSADYMWNSDDSTLMWNADDSTKMWK